MKFLLDESADYPLAQFLRDLGHDVTAIAHEHPHALKDAEVLKIAVSERRVLITNDRDFGELVFRRRLGHGTRQASSGLLSRARPPSWGPLSTVMPAPS